MNLEVGSGREHRIIVGGGRSLRAAFAEIVVEP